MNSLLTIVKIRVKKIMLGCLKYLNFGRLGGMAKFYLINSNARGGGELKTRPGSPVGRRPYPATDTVKHSMIHVHQTMLLYRQAYLFAILQC